MSTMKVDIDLDRMREYVLERLEEGVDDDNVRLTQYEKYAVEMALDHACDFIADCKVNIYQPPDLPCNCSGKT